MPSILSVAAMLGAFGAAITSAAPAKRATCSTSFPAMFQVREGSGYFGVSGGTITHVISSTGTGVPSTAAKFEVDLISHDGDPGVAQLSTIIGGTTYGAWVSDSTNGTIALLPAGSAAPGTDIPVVASLEADCTINLTLWEAHTDQYLQDCGGKIVLATSHETNCVSVTASLVQ